MVREKEEKNILGRTKKKQEEYGICEFSIVCKYAVEEDFEVKLIQFIDKFLFVLRDLLLSAV